MSKINTEFQKTEPDKKLKAGPKKRKLVIILILVCSASVIAYRLLSADHYKRFTEAEIGSSFSQVEKTVGGKYENGILTVNEKGQKTYLYRFENDKLAEKYYKYYGNGFDSSVNYENFCRANAAMTLSELEEIFGKARLIRQSSSLSVYLWMETPSQYVVFKDYTDGIKSLSASKMLNPKQNNAPVTLEAVNSLGIPSSAEELESRLGASVTVFKTVYRNDGYVYSCYVCTEDTEYDIFLHPGKYVMIIPSFLENTADPVLAAELHKNMTYSDTVKLFGTEGFLTINTSEYIEYIWVTSNSNTLISVCFDTSGYYTEHSSGTIDRLLLLFSPNSVQWAVPEYLH